MRELDLPAGTRAMIVDTVGFIAKLPHELVESFKGTLEHVAAADLILHVTDWAQPEVQRRISVVEETLAELGAPRHRTLLVHNKTDLVSGRNTPAAGLAVSARTGAGIPELLGEIERRLTAAEQHVEILLPHDDGRTRAWLYENARVLQEDDDPGGLRIVARVTTKVAGRLRRMLELQGAATKRSG